MISRRRFKKGLNKAKRRVDVLNFYNNEEGFERCLKIARKTTCMCSSPFCCGNPRRQKGKKNLTRQELRAYLKEE